jgi:hypothetical protein
MAARPLPLLSRTRLEKRYVYRNCRESHEAAIGREIQSIANAPVLRMHLKTVMKMRWVRIAGIAVAVLLVILLALP